MPLQLESPYLDAPAIPWQKGNLHTHTNESDGACAPQDVVDDYAARGYDFLMLSDHDRRTDPAPLKSHGMTLLPGNEVSAKGPHLLHVNAQTRLEPVEDRQRMLNAIGDEKGLAIFNHPNWQSHFKHCPQEKLEAWSGYTGIEIFNGVIRRLEGSPLATDRWDRLLGAGRRVWGFAHDDSHRPEDVEQGWVMVQCAPRSVEAIVQALAAGRFYASTGLTIDALSVHGRTLHLRAAQAGRITLSCDYGKRIAQADGGALTFRVPDDAPYNYVRLTCHGPGEAMAWTQPFFVKK